MSLRTRRLGVEEKRYRCDTEKVKWKPRPAFFSRAWLPSLVPTAFMHSHPSWHGLQLIEIPSCLGTALPFPYLVSTPSSHVCNTGKCPSPGSVWTPFTNHVDDEVEKVDLMKEKQEASHREGLPWSLITFLSLVSLLSWGLSAFLSLGSVYPYTKFPFSA